MLLGCWFMVAFHFVATNDAGPLGAGRRRGREFRVQFVPELFAWLGVWEASSGTPKLLARYPSLLDRYAAEQKRVGFMADAGMYTWCSIIYQEGAEGFGGGFAVRGSR